MLAAAFGGGDPTPSVAPAFPSRAPAPVAVPAVVLPEAAMQQEEADGEYDDAYEDEADEKDDVAPPHPEPLAATIIRSSSAPPAAAAAVSPSAAAAAGAAVISSIGESKRNRQLLVANAELEPFRRLKDIVDQLRIIAIPRPLDTRLQITRSGAGERRKRKTEVKTEAQWYAARSNIAICIDALMESSVFMQEALFTTSTYRSHLETQHDDKIETMREVNAAIIARQENKKQRIRAPS
jgi:hypothetical protein